MAAARNSFSSTLGRPTTADDPRRRTALSARAPHARSSIPIIRGHQLVQTHHLHNCLVSDALTPAQVAAHYAAGIKP
jgi:hypothetical protein